MQEAFDAVENYEGTDIPEIKLLTDLTDDKILTETATLASGVNVKLDLAGHTISKSTSGYTIQNEGTLTIIGSGTISNTDSSSSNLATPLNNEGTLTVGEVGGANEDNPTITGYWGIRNYGSSSSIYTLKVNSGTITGRRYGIYNYYGNATVTGGNISAGTNTSTSSTYGIYNAYGSATVTGGNISAEISATASSYVYGRGIFNTSNGTLTLGTLDSNTPLTTPTITGTSHGVDRFSGTFNYYDGTIIGSQSLGAIDGTVTATPTGYYPISSYSDNKETVTLGKAVARIGTTYYTTLQDAFDATSESLSSVSTVELLTNLSGTKALTETATLKSGHHAELDLAGHTISKSNSGYTIQNEGTLTIIGSGTISNTSSSSTELATPLNNEGTLTVGEEGGANEDNPTITGYYGIRNRGSSSSSRYTLIVNSGTITGRIVGMYNYYGKMTVRGGDISTTSTTATTYGIYSGGDSSSSVNVEGGDISAGSTSSTSSSCGIYNNYGSVTVTDGNISAKISSKASSTVYGRGIYNGNSGTLTLGELDTDTPETTPTVEGTSYGVYRASGTFNYYDGTIIGSSDKGAIHNTISAYPDEYGYYPIHDTTSESGKDIVTLGEPEAQISTTYYKTLQDAFDATTATQSTVLVLKDIELDNTVTLAEGKSARLNMNSHNIEKTSSGDAILNNGSLQLTGRGTISYVYDSQSYYAINNVGTLNITGAYVTVSGKPSSSTTSSTWGRAIRNTGTFTMSNGTVEGGSSGIYNSGSAAKLTLSGGTVKTTSKSTSTGFNVITNSTGATATIKGSAKVTTDPSGYGRGINNSNILNIEGGTVEGSYAIYANNSSSNINVSGGTITARYYSGIEARSGNVTVTGGNITGIYANDGVSLTLGTDDTTDANPPSTTTPKITSMKHTTTGIEATNLNFYDGIVISGSGGEAIQATNIVTPDGYMVCTSDNNGNQEAILLPDNYAVRIEETGEFYESLQDAVDAVDDIPSVGTSIADATRTLTVLKDLDAGATVNSGYTTDGNKSIKLNTNGKKINGSVVVADKIEIYGGGSIDSFTSYYAPREISGSTVNVSGIYYIHDIKSINSIIIYSSKPENDVEQIKNSIIENVEEIQYIDLHNVMTGVASYNEVDHFISLSNINSIHGIDLGNYSTNTYVRIEESNVDNIGMYNSVSSGDYTSRTRYITATNSTIGTIKTRNMTTSGDLISSYQSTRNHLLSCNITLNSSTVGSDDIDYGIAAEIAYTFSLSSTNSIIKGNTNAIKVLNSGPAKIDLNNTQVTIPSNSTEKYSIYLRYLSNLWSVSATVNISNNSKVSGLYCYYVNSTTMTNNRLYDGTKIDNLYVQYSAGRGINETNYDGIQLYLDE